MKPIIIYTMNNPMKLFFKNEDSEKNTKNNAAELNQANSVESVKVDLRELGYKKAGVCLGDKLELGVLKHILLVVPIGVLQSSTTTARGSSTSAVAEPPTAVSTAPTMCVRLGLFNYL